MAKQHVADTVFGGAIREVLAGSRLNKNKFTAEAVVAYLAENNVTMKVNSVKARVEKWRKAGVNIPEWDKTESKKRLNVSELNALLESSLNSLYRGIERAANEGEPVGDEVEV